MKIVFQRGEVDLKEALGEVAKCATRYTNFSSHEVGGQSIANFILPRESNGFEGFLRFPIPNEEEQSSNELHAYFAIRSSTPYRLTFVHKFTNGRIGLDVYDQIWAHKIACQLAATGVLKREVEKVYYGNVELDY